jgi:hypothetical protein
VLIAGDAGIGKSRLMQAFRERIALRAHTWLECRGSPYMQESAFYPVLELARRSASGPRPGRARSSGSRRGLPGWGSTAERCRWWPRSTASWRSPHAGTPPVLRGARFLVVAHCDSASAATRAPAGACSGWIPPRGAG